MPDIVTLISTVGFPIVACVGMGWYVKHSTDAYREDVKEIQREHKDCLNKSTTARVTCPLSFPNSLHLPKGFFGFGM